MVHGFRWGNRMHPLKYNMEPEHQPLEKEIFFWKLETHHFEVPCETFEGVIVIPSGR